MTAVHLNMSGVDSNVELPITLNLRDKGVALVEANVNLFPPKPGKRYYLCCDFVETSILQGTNSINVYPILRMIRSNQGANMDTIRENFQKLIYINCNRADVSNVRLYLIDEDGNLPSFDRCELKCTLLFIPHHG